MFDREAYGREYSRQYRQDHKAEISNYQKQYSKVRSQRHQQIKSEVLTHYSALGYLSCGCCGETDLSKLCIDHIQGGGNEHRRFLFGRDDCSIRFYSWLKRNNYPEGYQTLCLGCNKKKQRWEDENNERYRDALGRFISVKKLISATPSG